MASTGEYHHVRLDGTRRSGLSVDGWQALEYCVPGEGEWDPTLAWYVAAYLDEPAAPATQEQASAWLAGRAGAVEAALARAADALKVGVDRGEPWSRVYERPAGSVRVTASAMLVPDGHDFGAKIHGYLAGDWPALKAVAPVATAGV